MVRIYENVSGKFIDQLLSFFLEIIDVFLASIYGMRGIEIIVDET